SRRRHSSCKCDWSSEVGSSILNFCLIGGASGRTRIKQKFRAHPGWIDYWYPPKWELNDALAASHAAGATSTVTFTTREGAMDLKIGRASCRARDRRRVGGVPWV